MTKKTQVLVFNNSDILAKKLRSTIIKTQDSAFERHGDFRIAVSGGSLPAILAKALLATPSSGESDIDWGKWQIFFADERAVPLDDPQSNYKLLKDEILDHIPSKFGTPRVHTINPEYLNDLDELADQYEQELVQVFAARDSVRLPVFDLILLGCGPDGHTCSIFPGSKVSNDTSAWVFPVSDSPKPPPNRITLSMSVLRSALRIAFVATGSSKREIIKKIFDTDEGKLLPSAMVNELATERVSWFTDDEAVLGLNYPVERIS